MDTKNKPLLAGIALLLSSGLYIVCKLLGVEIPFAATISLILGAQ